MFCVKLKHELASNMTPNHTFQHWFQAH